MLIATSMGRNVATYNLMHIGLGAAITVSILVRGRCSCAPPHVALSRSASWQAVCCLRAPFSSCLQLSIVTSNLLPQSIRMYSMWAFTSLFKDKGKAFEESHKEVSQGK